MKSTSFPLDFARIVGLAGDDAPNRWGFVASLGLGERSHRAESYGVTTQSGFLWVGLVRIGSVATLVASQAGVRPLPKRVRVRRLKT